MLSIIVFILILAALVLVHEFGHFIVAKKSGMQVEEFGIGFPPRIFGKRKGETVYSINLIPLGGFVKILGENNEFADNPRSFINKGFWQRFFTLIAGVVMNFLFAWVLFSIGLGIGLPTAIAQGQPLPAHAHLRGQGITVLQITDNSPAQQAGIKEGDTIISADGKKFTNVDDLAAYIKTRLGQKVDFAISRGNANLDFKVLARPNAPADQGATGIGLGLVGKLSFPWYLTPVEGFKATIEVIAQTWDGFYALVRHGQGLSSLGGPIRIASLTNQVTKLGFDYVLQFAAFLSVNLGILNILPFPALDGGRVLFLLIEKVRGKRNNQNIENWVNTVGFALLIILVVLISFRDVRFLIHK